VLISLLFLGLGSAKLVDATLNRGWVQRGVAELVVTLPQITELGGCSVPLRLQFSAER